MPPAARFVRAFFRLPAVVLLAFAILIVFCAIDSPGDVRADTATSVSAGLARTCAVNSSEGVTCWGDGPTIISPALDVHPAPLPGLSGVAKVYAGGDVSCVLTVSGGVKCWGQNALGSLGDGTGQGSSTPVDVAGLSSGVTSLSVGHDFACAVVHGGAVCWGNNDAGQIGNDDAGPDDCNNTPCALAPVQVKGLTSNVATVAVSNDFAPGAACATMTAGNVKCWGSNASGRLGIGTATGPETCSGNFVADCSRSPVDVSGLSDAQQVAVGYSFACALSSDGGVDCWGNNFTGQLGNGTLVASYTPVAVTGLPPGGLQKITAGTFAACGSASDEGAWCWGNNAVGVLGVSPEDSPEQCPLVMQGCSSVPVLVPGVTTKLSDISSNGEDTCAILADGHIKCWGVSAFGNTGQVNRPFKVPGDVSGLSSDIAAISTTGGASICARTTAGVAKCWGAGDQGQLGTGADLTDVCSCSTVPVDVDIDPVTSIATGFDFACAVTGGAAKCWGYNNEGELGNGGTASSNQPVQVNGLTSGVMSVAGSGGLFSCAVLTSGGVTCWGANDEAQHGDGSIQGTAPSSVSGLTNAASVSASYATACALTTGGGVKCWGDNSGAQLAVDPADGPDTCSFSFACSKVPVDIPGLQTGVTQMGIGDSFGCALMTSGAVKCWGTNRSGELGTGSNTGPDSCTDRGFAFACSLTPVEVAGLSHGVTAISVGADDACALLAGGAVRCWGANSSGELGNGLTSPSYVPEDVAGLSSGVTAIFAGSGVTCAVMNSGGAKCWGDNNFGQLGNGQSTFAVTATDVTGFGGYETIGVPGDGSCDNQLNPADVVSALSRAAGAYSLHVCLGNMDVDCNNAVTIDDALLIMKHLASVITTFPCVS